MTVINTAALWSHLRKRLTVNLHGAHIQEDVARWKVWPRVQQCSAACLASPFCFNMAGASSPIHYVPKA